MGRQEMIYGSPILIGDNTIPGVQYSPELEGVIPQVIQACLDFGLDPYPPIVELLNYDDISEVAAFGGFPVRFPHWSFGAEYEQLSKGYQYGMHRIYEMVINTNPSYMYCLNSNTLLDHVLVIAHATGHSDFFKNNIWFGPTTENALNELANHGTRVRRYMDRWGEEQVITFIDSVLSIDNLIDFRSAWKNRKVKNPQIQDKRDYYFARKIKLPSTEGESHEYMDSWVNNDEWNDSEKRRIQQIEIEKELGLFNGLEKDVVGYLLAHAPLKPWQQDILAMLYREALYFAPQPLTKVANEGWASYVDYQIMARNHWAGPGGIFDYAKHKSGVLGGKYSMNPYSLGFKLFCHIEERWNKGRFGREYEMCDDLDRKLNWDTKAGLGHKKVFDVRANYNDLTLIHEFVDQEFVDKYELYVWEKVPSPRGGYDYIVKTRDAKEIKQLLLQRHSNGGRPDIRLAEPNYAKKHIFLLEHQWDGRMLAPKYAMATLGQLWAIWNNNGMASRYPVALTTKTDEGEEMVYVAQGRSAETVQLVTRKEFEKAFA